MLTFRADRGVSCTFLKAISYPSGFMEGRRWMRVSLTRCTMRWSPRLYSWQMYCMRFSRSSRPSTSFPCIPATYRNSGSPAGGAKHRDGKAGSYQTFTCHLVNAFKDLNTNHIKILYVQWISYATAFNTCAVWCFTCRVAQISGPHTAHSMAGISEMSHVILRNAHEEDSELTSLLTTNTAHNTKKVFKQRAVL